MPDSSNESVMVVEEAPAQPRRVPPRICAAPKIRQVFWCDFWEDAILPEMYKRRPVIIVSFKNTLHGHCSVLPTSTDPQEGKSAKWAHPLSIRPDGQRDTWVVCNHLCTVSTARLTPPKGNAIPRLSEDEFNEILSKFLEWLPKPR